MLSKGTHEMRGEELTAQAKPSRGGDAQVSSRHNEEVFPADTEGSHIFMFPCYLPGCSSPASSSGPVIIGDILEIPGDRFLETCHCTPTSSS